MTHSISDYQWLVGPAAVGLLEELAVSDNKPLADAARLRKTLSAARVHLLLEQAALRRRARQKFAAAEQMFFTPVGLEQATDEVVAAYKASRFTGQENVWDLCCGIGGDLLALARRGPATGVDRDAVTAIFAEANCRALATEIPHSVTLQTRDVASLDLPEAAAWHLDPDRRSLGRRTTRVEHYEPGLPIMERLLANRAAAIKLAPAAAPPANWQTEAELEWISRAGECRQLVAWFGPLAKTAGQRRATLVADGGFRSLIGDPDTALPVARQPGRYLVEPDAAVLAARLTGALAAEHDLAGIAPGAVYLTGDRVTPDAALRWFEITDLAPFDLKRFKALLRERRIGRLEVKKRGVDLDPARLARQLRVPGDRQATLLLVRMGENVVGILARRVG